MRIHSVTVRNYRGIKERKVELGPTGVTVVEGPNEIGKSSLAEALDIVFQFPDSTKGKRLNGVKTVDRDAGPEIELEADIGPYRIVYRKRFLKKPETVLTITEPKVENLTGREAHDRVMELLKAHVDMDLWQALCVLQGSIEPADLTKASSLAEALDHAAGGDVSGERERSIFDAVHKEYGIYYTDTGKTRDTLEKAASELEKEQAAVSEFERELHSVERLVQDCNRLAIEIAELEQQCVDARRTAADREEEARLLIQQEEGLTQLESKSRQSAEHRQRVAKDFTARQGQVTKVEQAEAAQVKLIEAQSKDSPALIDAETAESEARQQLEAAQKEVATSAQLVALRAADVDYRSNSLALAQLDERRQQIEEWQSKKDIAAETLSHCRLDETLLDRIRKAQGEHIRTEARLNAGSPRLRVTALGQLSLQLGTESRELQAGTSLEEVVREHMKLVIPSVVEIEIAAGASLDDLIRSHEQAEMKLADLLQQARMPSLEAAERASLEYRDARNCIASADKAIALALRDLTFEQMLAKIGRLKASSEGYPATRAVEPPISDSLDSAKVAQNVAQAQSDEVNQKHRAAKAKHEAAAASLAALRLKTATVGGQLIEVQSQLETLRQELAIARDNKSDVSLAQDLESAAALAAAAKTTWEAAQHAWRAKDPPRVRELAQNARKAADRMATELRAKQDEVLTASNTLDHLGGKGIFDDLEEARTRLDRATQHHATVNQRAAAAQLLFTTMKSKREEAQRAYAAPLRDKIIYLGRFLFGDSFDVELDDRLAIVSRTLDGRTLPFDSLSVGAQEQLGLTVRLACSLLVDPEQGVPLIFDDTLGHTDPQRLQNMGDMLHHAGRSCQIVILTCTPGRFRHIGEAKTIRLHD